jgi:hypothetical protein
MSDTYNGWKSYSTWRIALEFNFDHDLIESLLPIKTYDLSEYLKSYVQDVIDRESKQNTFSNSYAHAFVNQCDFYEIAEHLLQHVESEEA